MFRNLRRFQFRKFVTPISPQEGQKALRLARQALLNNVDGWWPRQKLRMRLFFMGQIRPMKVDDGLALFSWIFVSQSVFILVGTTSFVSILLFLANTLSFQGNRLCDYLSKWTGYRISFQSAIVPRWREGTIRFGNVQIVCNAESWLEMSRESAREADISFDPADVDLNFTFWNLHVDSIDITLSLWRWLDGRGIVGSAKFQGVRGVCDRAHIKWSENWVPSRREPQHGDFELDSLVINDALVAVNNPDFRPFNVSLFQCKLNGLRKQWMLYDILCAESIVGSIDDCLFSVHKPQIKDLNQQKELKQNWSKMLYGLPIDHLNSGATGPLGWITKGTLDLDLHMLVPHDTQNDGILDRILDEVDGLRDSAIDKFGSMITIEQSQPRASLKSLRKYGLQHAFNKPFDQQIPQDSLLKVPPKSDIMMLWKVKIKNLKANVPIVNPELSYMSNALIRPVVGYMNANKTLIPLSMSAQMDINNFNGAWDIYSSGLADILSEEVGRAIMEIMNDDKEATKRLKQIGLWTIAELSQTILNLMEHARGDRGWANYSGLDNLSLFG